ncbi:hypothetical protein FACS189487_10650 [Campylobacterota bacterium]|nr:hypothetical protein FACS189487_10650 [Campylobacterota bacterium]
MTLSAPKKIVFIISIVVAVLAVANALLGLVGVSINIPIFTKYAFWFLTGAYALLAAGVFFKDL